MKKNIQFITSSQIKEKISIVQAISILKNALESKVNQKSICPVRTLIWQGSPHAAFGSMPGLYTDKNLFVNKIASFVEHHDITQPLVNSVAIAFNTQSGKPLALIDGVELTNLKCAAVAGIVTAKCSSPEAKKLALIGAGTLAKQQLLAVLAVRDIIHVSIFNRSYDRARLFAEFIASEKPGIEVSLSETAEEAVMGADIICTATGSFTPILSTENIKSSVHMNIMGAHTPFTREVPQQLISESFVIVEERETAIKEAGALHEKAIDLFELINMDNDALAKRKTLFSSTGHIMMDMILTGEILSGLGLME